MLSLHKNYKEKKYYDLSPCATYIINFQRVLLV